MDETADEEVEVPGITAGLDREFGELIGKLILIGVFVAFSATQIHNVPIMNGTISGVHIAIVGGPILTALIFGEARVPVGALLLVGGVAAALFGYVTWQEQRDALQSMGVLGNLAKAAPGLQEQLQSTRIWLIAGASSAAFGLALLLSAVVWAVRSVRSQLTDG